jgi:hypothetical protein
MTSGSRGTLTAGRAPSPTRGYSAAIAATPSTPPTTWAPMYSGADEGAMPANESENIRPIVIAGLAKLAEEVKKYAAPM